MHAICVTKTSSACIYYACVCILYVRCRSCLRVYIYMHVVCMYICTCVSACMHLVAVILQWLRMCLTMSMHAYARVSEYVFGCVCEILYRMHMLHVLQKILNFRLRVYTHVYVYMCLYVCVCVCVCVCSCIKHHHQYHHRHNHHHAWQ